jgi:LPXTG-motif cell wall-anchored protein
LITSSGSTIELINGASECNVFWQVGSSATLGTGSVFVGNILALTSITVTSAVVVHGRALARNGAVTLDNDVFTQPSCTGSTATAAPATTVAATGTTTVGATVTTLAPTGFEGTDITLPRTGTSVSPVTLIGSMALVLGGLALVATRRRRPA